jgi:hypothetical protein
VSSAIDAMQEELTRLREKVPDLERYSQQLCCLLTAAVSERDDAREAARMADVTCADAEHRHATAEAERDALREKCAELEPRPLTCDDEWIVDGCNDLSDIVWRFHDFDDLAAARASMLDATCRIVRIPVPLAPAEPPTTLDLMNAEYAARYPKPAAAEPAGEPERCEAQAKSDLGSMFIGGFTIDNPKGYVDPTGPGRRAELRADLDKALGVGPLMPKPQPDAPGEAENVLYGLGPLGIDAFKFKTGKSAVLAEAIEKLRASGAIIQTAPHAEHWLARSAERAALRRIASETDDKHARTLALDALLGEGKP